jgi:Ni/Co efflux regulator RcnB
LTGGAGLWSGAVCVCGGTLRRAGRSLAGACKEEFAMRTLMISAAALALCASAAMAQDSEKTTTTVSTPAGTTQTTTTTTQSTDGYAQYRRTVTSTKHYTAGAFVGPSGYVYTRYAVDDRVPAAMLDPHFRIPHYSIYGLDTPPGGLVWIRVGNDALLVDNGSGEVVQAQYGLFE